MFFFKILLPDGQTNRRTDTAEIIIAFSAITRWASSSAHTSVTDIIYVIDREVSHEEDLVYAIQITS